MKSAELRCANVSKDVLVDQATGTYWGDVRKGRIQVPRSDGTQREYSLRVRSMGLPFVHAHSCPWQARLIAAATDQEPSLIASVNLHATTAPPRPSYLRTTSRRGRQLRGMEARRSITALRRAQGSGRYCPCTSSPWHRSLPRGPCHLTANAGHRESQMQMRLAGNMYEVRTSKVNTLPPPPPPCAEASLDPSRAVHEKAHRLCARRLRKASSQRKTLPPRAGTP